MNGAHRTLILSDGGIVSLLACAAARESGFVATPQVPGREGGTRPLVMASTLHPGSARAQSEAIARQCEALDLEFLGDASDHLSPDPDSAECHTSDLVRAGYAAIRHECSVVLWPAHLGSTRAAVLDAVSDAVDRALLIGRIMTIDSPGSPIRVDVPYVDLSDRQIADLVLDLDAPANLCWWWHAQLADPAVQGAREGFSREHRRWTAALSEVGWTVPA